MYAIIVLFIFIAFFLLYNTSKKGKWGDKPVWAIYFEKQKRLSVAISAILMLLACIMLVYDNGIVSGIFSFMVIVMTMGSLIVLLFPFRYLSLRQTVLLFLLCLVFEQLIF